MPPIIPVENAMRVQARFGKTGGKWYGVIPALDGCEVFGKASYAEAHEHLLWKLVGMVNRCRHEHVEPKWNEGPFAEPMWDEIIRTFAVA